MPRPDLHPLRILIATDAAREGVNFQNYCADLFHFDVPWNPSRMEQRNGRIDRKLQREEVVRCHYFVFTQRPEDHVIRTLVRKTENIRRELGSLSPVLERRIEDYVLRKASNHRWPPSSKCSTPTRPAAKPLRKNSNLSANARWNFRMNWSRWTITWKNPRTYVGLNPPDFINAISTALGTERLPAVEGRP